MVPGVAPATPGLPERDALVAAFIEAVQANDAEAIAALTDPVVDPISAP